MRAVEYALAHARQSEHRAADASLPKDVRTHWEEVASAWKLAAKQIGYFEHADTKTELVAR